MRGLLALILASLFAPLLLAQADVLAEGAYGVRGANKRVVVKYEWKMTSAAVGGFEVVARHRSGVEEVIRFDSSWYQRSYKLQKESGGTTDLFMNCEVNHIRITCEFSHGGTKVISEATPIYPFVLMSTELTTDPFWLNAARMRYVPRVIGNTSDVHQAIVVEYSDGRPKLEDAASERWKYVGRRLFDSVLGKIECDIFESDGAKVWVAPSNLVIAIDEEGKRTELVKLDDRSKKLLSSPSR